MEDLLFIKSQMVFSSQGQATEEDLKQLQSRSGSNEMKGPLDYVFITRYFVQTVL